MYSEIPLIMSSAPSTDGTALPVTNEKRYRESSCIQDYATSIGPVCIGDEPRRNEHYRGVIEEVIDRDCYGVRTLHTQGFAPKTIVDIGMHIGTFSLLCSYLWPGARIVGAEVMRDEHICGPFAQAIARSLDANIADSSNITVMRKALIGFYGDSDAEVVHAEDFGKSMPNMEDRIRTGMHRWAEGISVSDFLQENAIEHIDLLKIDVESSEVNIFREFAALNMLKNITIIRGEWHYSIARSELERLLTPTHEVEIVWSGPGEDWNTFSAVRR